LAQERQDRLRVEYKNITKNYQLLDYLLLQKSKILRLQKKLTYPKREKVQIMMTQNHQKRKKKVEVSYYRPPPARLVMTSPQHMVKTSKSIGGVKELENFEEYHQLADLLRLKQQQREHRVERISGSVELTHHETIR